MKRRILLIPDPRLKQNCAEVAEFNAALRALADDMLETMYDAPGVGLAGPQIGVMQRIIVMDCAKEDAPQPMIMVNPRITWASEELSQYEEGCLSIPEQYGEVTRPATVRVAWQDLDGALQEQELTDLWATCVQHEIDHLNGKLFIDYLGPMKRQIITRKVEKLKRDMTQQG